MQQIDGLKRKLKIHSNVDHSDMINAIPDVHVGVSPLQVPTVPGTSPAPRASSSPRAFLTSTPTTWSAPLSSSCPPAWMSRSPSSPLTWRTTPCLAEMATASTTGWRCGTDSQEVSLSAATRVVTGCSSRVGGGECQAGSLTAPLASPPSQVKHRVLRPAYIIIDWGRVATILVTVRW